MDGADGWWRTICDGAIYAALLEIAMAKLDNIIHQPVRLQIMSSLVALGAGEQVDFVYLRKILNLTDGNLGAHLAKLENAGYIKIEKTFVARKPRTFINTTGKGRDAFNEHTAALKQIIKGSKK
jgi:DNA-binding MarR family transcriptional regulator